MFKILESDIPYSQAAINGIKKYDDDSWQNVEADRYEDALMRHWCEYLKDRTSIDEESGMPHSWHMLTNAAFIVALDCKNEGGAINGW
jgi:hypothetical protein